MHILVVNNIYPPIMAGGAELIVSYLCEGLVARGHRVTVVSTCGPEMEPYADEVRNGVTVARFFPPNLYWSFTRDPQPGLKKALWHLRDAWNRGAARRFEAILQRDPPDVVHTHLTDGLSASIWHRAQQLGARVIHTAHDYHLLCPRAFLLTRNWELCREPQLACQAYRAWHLRTLRHVDTFISPSQFLLDRHVQDGMRVQRRAVVHNAVPQPPDVEGVRRNRTPESQRRFLFLTRLTVEKGVQVVLDAVAKLPLTLDVEVAIAGRGPLEDQVRAAAARDSRIQYLGYIQQEEKIAALTRAGHLLLPSLWYENAPVVILEAAAYGLSLVGSRIGGIPEFVEDGATGVLFPPGDATALAAEMYRLAVTPSALPSLPERSRALASRFTVDRMVSDYEREYDLLHADSPVALAETA